MQNFRYLSLREKCFEKRQYRKFLWQRPQLRNTQILKTYRVFSSEVYQFIGIFLMKPPLKRLKTIFFTSEFNRQRSKFQNPAGKLVDAEKTGKKIMITQLTNPKRILSQQYFEPNVCAIPGC